MTTLHGTFTPFERQLIRHAFEWAHDFLSEEEQEAEQAIRTQLDREDEDERAD